MVLVHHLPAEWDAYHASKAISVWHGDEKAATQRKFPPHTVKCIAWSVEMLHDLTGDYQLERLQVEVVQSLRIPMKHGSEVVVRLEASDVLLGGVHPHYFRSHPNEATVEPVRSRKMLLEVGVTDESKVKYPLSARLV